MKRTTVALTLVLLLAASACGDDGGVAATNTTAASSTTSATPRLVCPGGDVESFKVLGGPIGEPLRGYSTPQEAADAAVDDPQSIALIGNEGDDVRFAVVSASGEVVGEVVISNEAEGWRAVQHDSCPA